MLEGEELHVAAPNGGEVEVYTCPEASSAMQLVLEGQARAEMSLAPSDRGRRGPARGSERRRR